MYDTFVRKECLIEFKNNRSPLPKDFYRLISLKIGGSYPEITNRDFRLFDTDSPNLAIKGNFNYSSDASRLGFPYDSSDTNKMAIKFNIDNNYINISSTTDGTKAGLAYTAFDLDEDGFPLIKDGHQMAVSAYVTWKLKNADYVKGKVSPTFVIKSDTAPTSWELVYIKLPVTIDATNTPSGVLDLPSYTHDEVVNLAVRKMLYDRRSRRRR